MRVHFFVALGIIAALFSAPLASADTCGVTNTGCVTSATFTYEGAVVGNVYSETEEFCGDMGLDCPVFGGDPAECGATGPVEIVRECLVNPVLDYSLELSLGMVGPTITYCKAVVRDPCV